MKIFLLIAFCLGFASCEQPADPIVDTTLRIDTLTLSLSSDSVKVGDSVFASVNLNHDSLPSTSFEWYIDQVKQMANGSAMSFVPDTNKIYQIVFSVLDQDQRLIASDTAILRVGVRPTLVLSMLEEAVLFTPFHASAILTNYDLPVTYEWSMGENFEVKTSLKDSWYTYLRVGSYTVTCTAKDSVKGTVVASGTHAVTVVQPSIILNRAWLDSYDKLQILFEGDHHGYGIEGGIAMQFAREWYGVVLPTSGEKLTHSDSGFFFNNAKHSIYFYDSINKVYESSLDTQYVNAVIGNNSLKQLHIYRMLGSYAYAQGSTTYQNEALTEFTLSDLSLIYQSPDSIVFAFGGPALETHLSLTARDVNDQGIPRLQQSHTYNGTDYNSLKVRPLCRVKFAR